MRQPLYYDFLSMDTMVEVQVLGTELKEQFLAALQGLPNWFNLIEQTVSRFNPASELCRLNDSKGGAIKVSFLLLTLIEQALAAAQKTEGIFDPTVLNSLLQSGYDKTFSELTRGSADDGPINLESPGVQSISAPGCERAKPYYSSYRDIKVDPTTSTVTLTPGLRIDLGGIAKGWAVDQAMEDVLKWQKNAEICINAGGDLRLHLPSGREPWKVAVQNPFDRDQDLGYLSISGGAVATSSVLKRRWQDRGRVRHHLIDPRLSQPSRSDVVAATVVAPTAAEAEVWTKTICILGLEKGFALLARQADWAALGVLDNGKLLLNKPMEEIFIH